MMEAEERILGSVRLLCYCWIRLWPPTMMIAVEDDRFSLSANVREYFHSHNENYIRVSLRLDSFTSGKNFRLRYNILCKT